MMYICIRFVQISKLVPFQKNKEEIVVVSCVFFIKRKREKVSKIKRKNFSNKSRAINHDSANETQLPLGLHGLVD